MDDSWRVRMGTPAMESATSLPRRRRSLFADPGALNPEDFSDVFGGPPRSVFLRKMAGGEFSVPAAGVNSFYEEIFWPQDSQISGDFAGRGLPAFRIPDERFYSDVFGAESAGEERWKAMSKSNSSSVLSSEDMSPLRPIGGDPHMAFADLSSKLRPLNVGSRRNSSSMNKNKNNSETISKKNKNNNNNNISSFYTNPPSQTESHNWNSSYGIKYNFGFSRRVSSPETISLGPESYPSVKVSGDESPSSVVSSLCHEDEDDKTVEASSEDDDEMMSSYVIEIGSGSDRREGTNNSCDAAVCIDEAIAWAKESFHSHSAASEKDSVTNTNNNSNNEVKDDQLSKMDQDQNMENKHGIVQYSPKMEMRLQDENVRLWSVGKETDIRLLLSTLHYILWNNSGWSAIPLTNLINSTQLKKAYQKARLCLHPDKLQQRGATLPQKYIAEKTFSILQDAWSTFISQNVS